MVLQNDAERQPLIGQHSSTALREDERDVEGEVLPSSEPDKKVVNDEPLAAPSDEEEEYTWRTVVMIMSTWIGVFLASADMSVMATLTGPISESFSSFNLLTWFINSYTLTSALAQPLSGKLSDIYGRRNCLLYASLTFALGNLICGLSTKSWHFILGRAIAGLGGGCLHSISTFLASDVIPLRSRGFWQGVSNIAFAAGFALGGTLGGVIQGAVGWKWAFLFQPFPILISMGFVSWLVPKFTNPQVASPSLRRIDFLGSATLTVSILCLMFGAVSGGNTLPWSSPLVFVPILLFPFFLAAFLYIEDKVAKDPIIPVRSLANRTALGSCLTNLLGTTANTGLLYYLPMIMEVRGLTPAQAGLRQASGAVGVFIGSLGAGALMNYAGKYYWLCLSGHICLIGASLATLLTLKYVTGWYVSALFFVNGLGFGTMLVTTLLALISSGNHKEHAVLTSASYTFRTAGSTLGTTIAGAIFQNIFDKQLWNRFGSLTNAKKLIPAIRKRQLQLDDLPEGWRSGVMRSYDHAFHWVFVFIFATYVMSTVAVSVIREHQLSKRLNRA